MPTVSEIEDRVLLLLKYNEAYRSGNTLISDLEYDSLVEELRQWDPSHPFLHTVEEDNVRGKKITHSSPMLSTEKAYTQEALRKFVDRMERAAKDHNFSANHFRVTPKLDGMAGKDENGILASRGNGREGTDITHAFDIGIIPIGGRNQGVGEIVSVLSYFQENCAHVFTHPRNMVVGCISSDDINEESRKALQAGAIHFVPYMHLNSWEGGGEELIHNIEHISQQLAEQVDYPLDGMVAEITNPDLKNILGSTNHHHRWQIAIKTKGDTARTVVQEIGWQTGKTGKITPVLRVTPVEVSGAMISNITAHHAGMVKSLGLGAGAEIEIIRSGEVIPKLEAVHKPAIEVSIPSTCPACNAEIIWENDFILCTNQDNCPAQQETAIRHFFKTLGTADGFGPKSIEVLVAKGYHSLPAIFSLKKEDFFEMDFGEKQSENFENALQSAIQTPLEDARFLAAFGIANLGLGASRTLLEHHSFPDLGALSAEDLLEIDGFGEKTALSISQDLQKRWPEILHIYNRGFQLNHTPLRSEQKEIESSIAGKIVMFTGKMEIGNRDEMKQQSRELGASVISAVSKKLEILVIGSKPSASKVDKARKFGAQVLTEQEWIALLKSN